MLLHLCKEIRISLSLVHCSRLDLCNKSNQVRSSSPHTEGIGSSVRNGVCMRYVPDSGTVSNICIIISKLLLLLLIY